MKRNFKRIFSLLFAALTVAMLALPAVATYDNAEPNRSSAYIGAYYADVTKNGDQIDVYFQITGTGTMTSIGATDIAIMDQRGHCVALLDSSNTSGLMGSNTFFYSNTITWTGAVSGMRYYAIVGFKAGNSTGYDTTCYTTLFT